ncbi:MAG TPA: serine/threonine-protein kinase [Thermoanaerobaculia bacterium]|nr:serine/threonine-protein kinase [Thermoanaerobaculia bacterium]
MISPLVGQETVGRFAIKDFLGRGAIGDVLLAWDPREERLVALKVVRVARTDPEMLEAEKNGLSLQAKLAGVAPQVAAVFEQGQDGDLFWVAMEYVAGSDLSQLLAKGPLAEERATGITLELVSMLEVCHGFVAEVGGRPVYGIVHGDIKPENIRLQQGDRVRVLDFGIAKHLSQTRRFTVNLFGSLPYTPPERLERGVVDRHSDLWAAGVVLAAMVSGRRPFPGNTPEELEQAIRHGLPRLPLPAGCSPGLAHVVDRALAFEVGRRYQTAAELKSDLAALREGRPLPSAAPAPARGAAAAADLHATRRTTRPLSAEEMRPPPPPAPPPPNNAADPLLAASASAGNAADDRLAEGAAEAADGRLAGRAADATESAGAAGAAAVMVAGAADALEATRRTERGLLEGAEGAEGPASALALHETRRTGPAPALATATASDWAFTPIGVPPGGGAPEPAAAAPAALSAAPAALSAVRQRRRLRRAVLVLAGASLIVFGASQLRAWNQAQQLRHDLAEVHPDLDAIVQRYGDAARWCWLTPDLFGVGDDLRRSLAAAAGRILDSYHGDDPTTTLRGWETAYRYLHAAAQIAPRDRSLRARMLYARAHIDRIAALTLRNQGERKKSLDGSREAAAEFQEAARLDPAWADPYLGLARIYAYDTFDLDALQKTMGELGRRGYRLGRRETAMLADGLRMQGLALEARAQRARGREGEIDLLKQARDALDQAVRDYDEISGYAFAASNRAEAAAHLAAVESRLGVIHQAGFWERVSRALSREFRRPGGA